MKDKSNIGRINIEKVFIETDNIEEAFEEFPVEEEWHKGKVENVLREDIENFGMLISSNLEKLKFNANILLEKDFE